MSTEAPPAGVRPDRRRVLRLDDLRTTPPLEWLVPGFVHRKTVALLAAPENSYKTFAMFGLALSIVHGRDWHGLAVPCGDVLYIAGEGDTALGARLRAWEAAHPDAVAVGELIVPAGGLSFMGGDMATQVGQMLADAEQPVLVVVDTVSSVIPGEDQNATGPMTKLIDQAQRLVDRFGAACLLVHHAPKGRGSEVRGSGSLQAGARSRITMVPQRPGRVLLKATANNDAEPGATLALRFAAHGESGVLELVGSDDDGPTADDDDVRNLDGGGLDLQVRIEEALHVRGGERTTKADVAAKVGRRSQTVSAAVEELAADPTSRVAVSGEGRGRRYFCRCDDHGNREAKG